VDEALEVIRDKLHNDNTLSEESTLHTEVIMELLEVCSRTTYVQMDGRFFQQNDSMVIRNS
jgi:hypothetical protein